MRNTVKRISVFDNAITYYITNEKKKKWLNSALNVHRSRQTEREEMAYVSAAASKMVMTKRQTNKIHFFHITWVERVRIRCCIECRQQRPQTLQKSSIPETTNLNEWMRRIYCPKPYWNAFIIVTNSTNFVVTWVYFTVYDSNTHSCLSFIEHEKRNRQMNLKQSTYFRWFHF